VPDEGPINITILHVNDIHGHTEPRTVDGKSVGGYARLSTYVDEVRNGAGDPSAKHPMLLVHAGDEFSRGDELTRATLGEANVSIMNFIKFDFWTPGNGEYYDGMDNLTKRIAQADFPVLAANVFFRNSGKPIARQYVIRRVGPVNVAFIGLCFVRAEHPSAWELSIKDPIQTARELVPQLRKQAQVVVALTHLGVDQDQKLAAAVPGIDLIIGGHTHTAIQRPADSPGKPMICQAGEYLNFVGQVDLTLTWQDGKYVISRRQAKLVPLDQRVKLDPAVTALIAKLWEKAPKPLHKPAQAPQPQANLRG
jgi:2',3'-cyclic-nucleotide 2'-phosphodiesterase (5'-nucleotidase family)